VQYKWNLNQIVVACCGLNKWVCVQIFLPYSECVVTEAFEEIRNCSLLHTLSSDSKCTVLKVKFSK
jgi:hypothetical protein